MGAGGKCISDDEFYGSIDCNKVACPVHNFMGCHPTTQNPTKLHSCMFTCSIKTGRKKHAYFITFHHLSVSFLPSEQQSFDIFLFYTTAILYPNDNFLAVSSSLGKNAARICDVVSALCKHVRALASRLKIQFFPKNSNVMSWPFPSVFSYISMQVCVQGISSL